MRYFPARPRVGGDVSGLGATRGHAVVQSALSLLGMFADHAFLKALGEQCLTRLAAHAEPLNAPAGTSLAREGEPARAFYLIQAGRVVIETRAPDGGSVAVDSAGPGDVVGWSWLDPPHHWQFTCKAVDDVRGLKLDAAWLRDQCEQDPALGYRVAKHLLAVVARRLAAVRKQAGAGQAEVVREPPNRLPQITA